MSRMAQEIGIPPCPAILSRFSEEMNKPEPEIRALGTLIGTDIALSGALLKLVNSPFYGLRANSIDTRTATAQATAPKSDPDYTSSITPDASAPISPVGTQSIARPE